MTKSRTKETWTDGERESVRYEGISNQYAVRLTTASIFRVQDQASSSAVDHEQ